MQCVPVADAGTKGSGEVMYSRSPWIQLYGVGGHAN